jgi:hypothetical protein
VAFPLLFWKHHKNSFFMLFQLKTAMAALSRLGLGLERGSRSVFVQRGSACHAPGCLAQVHWAQARLSSGIVSPRNEEESRRGKVPDWRGASSNLKSMETQVGLHTFTLFDNLTWVISWNKMKPNAIQMFTYISLHTIHRQITEWKCTRMFPIAICRAWVYLSLSQILVLAFLLFFLLGNLVIKQKLCKRQVNYNLKLFSVWSP